MNVKANFKPDWPENPEPGDFTYSTSNIWKRADSSGKYEAPDKLTSLIYCCPCGCGDVGPLRLRYEENKDEHPTWIWDGNIESPTLTPSVLHTVGCKWHGHLTKGEWIKV